MADSTAHGRFVVDEDAVDAARDVLARTKVAIFIVAFEAERFIESVLDRIPPSFATSSPRSYIVDDASSDRTFETATCSRPAAWAAEHDGAPDEFNQGYGGNQKVGYLYAIAQGFDSSRWSTATASTRRRTCPCSLGRSASAPTRSSRRMIDRRDALKAACRSTSTSAKGPHRVENPMLRQRPLRVPLRLPRLLGRSAALDPVPAQLERLPLRHRDHHPAAPNADTRIVELPIPTYYGDEICRVNGIKYAVNCLKAVTKAASRTSSACSTSRSSTSACSSRQRVPAQEEPTTRFTTRSSRANGPPTGTSRTSVQAAACISALLAERVAHVTSVDRERPARCRRRGGARTRSGRRLRSRARHTHGTTASSALDVIEHLRQPEVSIKKVAAILKPGGTLYASTGNIAFIVMRAEPRRSASSTTASGASSTSRTRGSSRSTRSRSCSSTPAS